MAPACPCNTPPLVAQRMEGINSSPEGSYLCHEGGSRCSVLQVLRPVQSHLAVEWARRPEAPQAGWIAAPLLQGCGGAAGRCCGFLCAGTLPRGEAQGAGRATCRRLQPCRGREERKGTRHSRHRHTTQRLSARASGSVGGRSSDPARAPRWSRRSASALSSAYTRPSHAPGRIHPTW